MKIFATSDTHGRHLDLVIPMGIDTIIHCGDFTYSNRENESETIEFLDWFSSLDIKNKIMVAGNHESFLYNLSLENKVFDFFKTNYPQIYYLEDSSIILDGIKFYGTPWTEEYGYWSFMCKNDKELAKKYRKIDNDTNVLISHNPALGVLDWVYGRNVGSDFLYKKTRKLKKLKYHIHGHIHEAYGIETNGDLTSINCAFLHYLFENQGSVIEIN